MTRAPQAGASSANRWFSRAAAGVVLVLGAVFAIGSRASAADFEEVTVREIVFVRIPPGSFTIGTTDEAQAELKAAGAWTRFEQCEQPAHPVTISKPFLIGKYEITQKQWSAVMGKKNAPFAFKGETLPVESVSWTEAQSFLAALNKLEGKVRFRLPTEAEWEYCCRAASAGAYGLAAARIVGRIHAAIWQQRNGEERRFAHAAILFLPFDFAPEKSRGSDLPMLADVLSIDLLLFLHLWRCLLHDVIHGAVDRAAKLGGKDDVRVIEEGVSAAAILRVLQPRHERVKRIPKILFHHRGLIGHSDGRLTVLGPERASSPMGIESSNVARFDEECA